MKKLGLIVFAVFTLLFAIVANAEVTVKKQGNGGYLVKKRMEKTLASIPPLPNGISIGDEVVLQLYTGKLPGVVVEGKMEKKITNLFPPTFVTKERSDVRLKFVAGKWKLTELPAKAEKRNNNNTLLGFLVVISLGVLVVSICNRLHGNLLVALMFFYILLILAAVGATAAATVVVGAVAAAVTVVVTVVVAASVGVGTDVVIKQYFSFLVVVEIAAFVIATGAKKIRDIYKKRKPATSVSVPTDL